MMMTEGKGKVAPRPVLIVLSDHDVRVLIEMSKQQAAKYADRKDDWGKGLASTKLVYPQCGTLEPHEVGMFRGKCGEYALADYLNKRCGIHTSIDGTVRERGDGGTDLDVRGIKLQVKTRAEKGVNLIRVKSGEPCFAAYVFCELRDKSVALLGWIKAADAHDVRFLSDSRMGSWLNYLIPDVELLPLSRLADEVLLRCH